MRFGFHISIAAGFSRVIAQAQKIGCETIQLFSRNPRGWLYKNIPADQVEDFKAALKASGIAPCFLHLPYLPNLASANRNLYAQSIEVLCQELRRAEVLTIPFLVVHVGKRLEQSRGTAVARVVSAVNRALRTVPNEVTVLLENTAGQGTELGADFAELGEIRARIDDQRRVGICLDVAHAFQAGYNFSTRTGLDETLEEFDRHIGLTYLHLLHLNDSKTPLGSRIDLHWHIGKGHIGLEGFRYIVNHPLLTRLPGIMETPRMSDKDDISNMKIVRKLSRG